jgi:hypothetical protein
MITGMNSALKGIDPAFRAVEAIFSSTSSSYNAPTAHRARF